MLNTLKHLLILTPRIRQRNRDHEACLPDNYLQGMHEKYYEGITKHDYIFESSTTEPKELAGRILDHIHRVVLTQQEGVNAINEKPSIPIAVAAADEALNSSQQVKDDN